LLILRGVSLELRNHIEVGVWRALLDGLFGLASALLTIFFGAALANVLRGVPLETKRPTRASDPPAVRLPHHGSARRRRLVRQRPQNPAARDQEFSSSKPSTSGS